ncbi:MAG: cystathionine beta-synthase, partial [Flavobacteriaceae bacterium]|nr:cystathionine beta-synthase [Flavobacteriaceae bacterium]
MKKHKSVYNNVLQLIGETPLVKLNNITSNFNGKFYAKLESFNP